MTIKGKYKCKFEYLITVEAHPFTMQYTQLYDPFSIRYQTCSRYEYEIGKVVTIQ